MVHVSAEYWFKKSFKFQSLIYKNSSASHSSSKSKSFLLSIHYYYTLLIANIALTWDNTFGILGDSNSGNIVSNTSPDGNVTQKYKLSFGLNFTVWTVPSPSILINVDDVKLGTSVIGALKSAFVEFGLFEYIIFLSYFQILYVLLYVLFKYNIISLKYNIVL